MTAGAARTVPLYFGPAGAQLFGWFHQPEREPRGPVVVICPPLGYDMIMSYRGLRHLADALARAGMPTLRFDYHGTGDSSGSDYEPDRVPAWLASIGHAIDEAKRLTGASGVALVGVRLGSLLAMYAAAGRADIEALVAWAAVGSGRARVRELRAFEQLMSGDDPIPDEVPTGAVAAAGFILTEQSVLALHELEVSRLPAAPAPRVLVVPRDDLRDDGKVAAALADMGVEVTTRPLPGYFGMMKDAHATSVPTEAIAGIVAWLGEVPATALRLTLPPAHATLRCATSSAALMDLALPGQPMPIRERPFRAHDGRLFGIVSEPAGECRTSRPAVILANAGAVHRVGSNRLYVEFARALAERGFRVVRLDIGGLGDSPAFPGMDENQTYPSRAVADVAEAAAVLRVEHGHPRVIVGGLCSGAHTAFHAGLELEDVAGLVMLNPIVFYWKPSDALDVAAWMTYQRVSRYKQNMARPDAWKRVLSGQVNLGHVARTLLQRTRDSAGARVSAVLRDVRLAVRGDQGGENAPKDLAQMCARGTEVLLLFSEGDPGLDFLRLNHWRAVRRLQRQPTFALEVIPQPGHTFTKISAQRTVLSAVVRHLLERFG